MEVQIRTCGAWGLKAAQSSIVGNPIKERTLGEHSAGGIRFAVFGIRIGESSVRISLPSSQERGVSPSAWALSPLPLL